jgi:hypothetical protein
MKTKPETPAQETKRLKREMEAAQERIAKLRNAALLESMMNGLKLIGKNGGSLLVTHFHEGCIDGTLYLGQTDKRGTYEAGEACGLERGYHSCEAVSLDRVTYLNIRQNDGKLSCQISISRKENEPKLILADSLRRFRAFLAGVGISIDASQFIKEREQLMEEVGEKTALINSLNGVDAVATLKA